MVGGATTTIARNNAAGSAGRFPLVRVPPKRKIPRRGLTPTDNCCIPAAIFYNSLPKKWRCGAESNRRIELLQSSALPLGYRTGKNGPQLGSFSGLRQVLKFSHVEGAIWWDLTSGQVDGDVLPEARPEVGLH